MIRLHHPLAALWRYFIGLIVLALLAACAGTGPDPQIRQSLAPSGSLRIGVYLGSPTSMVVDSKGEKVGVSIGLGQALAQELGVPAQVIEYKRVAEVVDAMATGEVDFNLTMRPLNVPSGCNLPSPRSIESSVIWWDKIRTFKSCPMWTGWVAASG